MLAMVLAFGLLGARGIWDPDEGRYSNVALMMLDSGDWLNPRRNDEIGHWTKPPLTYWAIAGSIAAFGQTPWAARLPQALAYLACVWLVWRIARRLAPGEEDSAAVIYATMLFTVGAAQLITTDYLLSAFETLAMWAFVELRFGEPAQRRRWTALMWAAFALAFLTKGPPALLPLLVMVACDRLVPRAGRTGVFDLTGALLFVLLAAPWFIAVMAGNPGLYRYFIGDEVINRVTTNEFGRHGQWYGWLTIYLPTLLIGTLPWTGGLLRWARDLPAQVRRWRLRETRVAQAHWLLPSLWLLLPLLVFCLARSRLPLYLLPLFSALAILITQQRAREGRGFPRWPWLVAWCVVVLGLRVASIHWPTHKNAAEWAEQIRARHPAPLREVVFVEDMARYGLHLHLDTEIERVSLTALPPHTGYAAPVYDSDFLHEVDEAEPGVVWVSKQERMPEIRAQLASRGKRAVALGAPYQNRIIFRLEPVE